MRKLSALVVVALCAMTTAGCGAGMANVSNEKTAYVIRSGFLGTSMYHCTAESGKPVCTKVIEQ